MNEIFGPLLDLKTGSWPTFFWVRDGPTHFGPLFGPLFLGFGPLLKKKTGPNFLPILSKNGSKMVKKGVKIAYFSCFSTKIDTFWVNFEEMKIFGPLCPLFFLFNCEKKIYIFIKFLK